MFKKTHYASSSLVLVVFTTFVLFSCCVVSHVCIHDTEIVPMLRKNPPVTLWLKEEALTTSEIENRQAQILAGSGSAPQRIRFSVSTLDLFNSSQFCTAAGDVRPNFKGSTLVCSSEDIFTTAKRDALINTILPRALDLVGTFLHVVPLTSAITGIHADICTPFTIPQDHIDNGVNDTDFVYYVAAGPTVQNNVAFAGQCAVCSQGLNHGRPIVGRLDVSPKYIKFSTEAEINAIVRTLVHETFHALGYSATNFQDKFNSPNRTDAIILDTTRRGGIPVKILNTSRVVNETRQFFNCSSCQGMELEDEGGLGTSMSHCSRSLYYESIMTGVDNVYDKVSRIELAVFADMQYYYPNWSAAEPMYYGNKTGCTFLNEKCTSPNQPKRVKDLFCYDPAVKTTNGVCNFNLRTIANCGLSNYSILENKTYFSYYSGQGLPLLGGTVNLMDFCPFGFEYPTKWCSAGDINTGGATEKIVGYTFGPSSRCIHAPTLIEAGYQTPDFDNRRCALMKCHWSGCNKVGDANCTYRLQVQIRSAGWMNCPIDGSEGVLTAPAGYTGSLTCPLATDVCDPEGRAYDTDLFFEFDTMTTTTTPAPPTTTPPPPTTSSTTTTTTTTTTTILTTATTTTDINGSTPMPPNTTTTVFESTTSTLETATSDPNTESTTVDPSLTAPSGDSTSSNESTTAIVGDTTTTIDPSAKNAGNLVGDINPAACFLASLPCFVSYILLALGILFALLILWYVFKKMCGGDEAGADEVKKQQNQQQQKQKPNQQQRQHPADAPLLESRYATMENEMKRMNNAQIASATGGLGASAAVGVAIANAPPPIVSPAPNYISADMQQISPRQMPHLSPTMNGLQGGGRPAPMTIEFDDDL